jgi:tyrosyl-tRNA synthetase
VVTAEAELVKLVNGLTLDERFELVKSVGEECVQESELRALLKAKESPRCYDGFEPSGRIHIAQGVQKAISVNKLTRAGCTFVFWVADWFALMNDKMGGDLNKIQTVGRYMIEVWRAVGMDMTKVEFLWSSEEINKRAGEYWPLVMDIARRNNLSRIKRCGTIMGRNESDEMSAAQILYPCMQCADIFFLKADICQLGMDQRKVNMLAREYAEEKKMRFKPIILSHHMLPGLKQGQEKMSKSDPESAIFMEDTEQDVKTKIKKAFCPPQVIEGNPVLEYIDYVILPWSKVLKISRPEEHGGNKEYTSMEEVKADFASGVLHPGDLKPAVAQAINEILEPVRQHFERNPDAKKLLEQVKKFRVTR